MTQDIKEILEFAAKAMEPSWNKLGCWNYRVEAARVIQEFGGMPGHITNSWRPHLDDGDGARMEAELGIEFGWPLYGSVEDGIVAVGPQKDNQVFVRFADHNGNRQAARRMASLRVDAEIGKGVNG